MKQETLNLCLEVLTNEYNQAEATVRILEHQLAQPQEYRVDEREEGILEQELYEQRKWRDSLEEAIQDFTK